VLAQHSFLHGSGSTVSEVMVNGPDDVYVERKGRLEKVTDGLFEGEEAVLHVIERPRSAFGSMSHHLGWMRDCRTAVGCRPDS
jgi:pilus assembly protein CpaF